MRIVALTDKVRLVPTDRGINDLAEVEVLDSERQIKLFFISK